MTAEGEHVSGVVAPVPGVITPAPSGWRNPLRDKRDKRMPRIAGPCGVVIFGVTGDLARKKLMPAIYDLANRGLLPPSFALVGFARRDWADQDFAKEVHDAVREHARTEFREDVWNQLSKGFRFVAGEFTDDAAFDQLAATLAELDEVKASIKSAVDADPDAWTEAERDELRDLLKKRWHAIDEARSAA